MGEYITRAAVRANGVTYSMPRPARHHTILHALYDEYVRQGKEEILQGFVTSEHRFVEREEAGQIAIAAGQIEKLNWPPRLYSEDLW